MNIFYLDHDPHEAAKMHCDRHVVKMILECAQLLSTAHRVLAPEAEFTQLMYKKTHANHPCAIWIREGRSNYMYVYALMLALNEEYKFRFEKSEDHLSVQKLKRYLRPFPHSLPFGSTPVRLAMPEDCHNADPVEAYRAYYRNHKQNLHKWTKRGEPAWLNL